MHHCAPHFLKLTTYPDTINLGSSATMADPLSSAASVITLAQIALSLGRSLGKCIDEFRTVQASYSKLAQDIHELNDLIAVVEQICRPQHDPTRQATVLSRIETTLQHVINDTAQLKTIFDQLPKDGGKITGTVNRLILTKKLLARRKPIAGIQNRLEKHQRDLSLCISATTLAIVATQHPKFVAQCDPAAQFVGLSASEGMAFISNYYKYMSEPLAKLVQISPASVDSAHWLLSQINTLSSEAFLQSSKSPSLQWKPLVLTGDTSNPENEPERADLLVANSVALASKPETILSTALCKAVAPSGDIIIVAKEMGPKPNFKKSSRLGNATRRGHVSFLPLLTIRGPRRYPTGILTTFTTSAATEHLQIYRRMSTFRVLPPDAPVFSHLRNRDTVKIHEMLQQRVIHPEDRDADGNSLLHYVISSTYSADMCRLLLQHGADPSNCNLYGDHALAILLASLPQLVTDASKGLSESDKILIRLLLGVGHDEITSHSRYLKKGAPHLAPTGVFHCLLSRHNARHIDLPALLFNMIENKFDLEATDLHGNTPLLFALYYLPAPQLFPVARLLLRHGANSNARNNFGEDGLHMLLRRLSACDSSPASFVDDFVALLTTLLHAGADPTRGNQYGSTAIDKAMTPTCFPLFCRALLTAGRNPRSVVSLACDARIPPPLRLTASEIDAAHRRALASRFALLGYHIIPKSTESLRFVTDAAPCCLCGGRLDWNRQRAMPFDEFNSVVVDEFGFPIHMTWYMHCLGGTRCLQIYREDSSHALDYWVEEMNVEELRGRSLRRHVALRLWEEGYLDGEGARGRWEGDVAAGVGT